MCSAPRKKKAPRGRRRGDHSSGGVLESAEQISSRNVHDGKRRRPPGFGYEAQSLAPRLKAENVKIQLTGHTCAWGPKELNQKISEKRAQVAKEAFVARGVPAENIETRGIADAETIGDQKTVAGRVASRRVTFKVLQ